MKLFSLLVLGLFGSELCEASGCHKNIVVHKHCGKCGARLSSSDSSSDSSSNRCCGKNFCFKKGSRSSSSSSSKSCSSHSNSHSNSCSSSESDSSSSRKKPNFKCPHRPHPPPFCDEPYYPQPYPLPCDF